MTPGRRIPYPGGDPAFLLERAGDYCGPVSGYTGAGIPAVFFLLPNARDQDSKGGKRAIHHVCSPPHRFVENPDGTLSIFDSIGADPHWHGFLENGNWRPA